ISKNVQKTTSGSIPVLKPEIITQIFDSINRTHQRLTAENVQHVILASPNTRVTFKKLISYNFPNLAVVSLNEVPNEVQIETVGMISLNDM
ncbi:MAG: FHIPEP family type III secretion protein, partial [Vagococcus sp.]